RFLPEGFDQTSFLDSGDQGRILVAGDGNLVKSNRDMASGDLLPLGEDPFAEGLVANRVFIQNALNYLLEPEGIIASRSKQYKIRPLDQFKIRDNKSYWYFLNIGAPVGLIILAGSLKVLWRKRRFGR